MADEKGPVPLLEDGATGDRFLVYTGKAGAQVELRVEGDTFWATQQQMADAFGVTRPNVTAHLLNIFKEGELVEAAVCKESLLTARDGKSYTTKLYDLNALISVGYRVGGSLGTAFRVWATDKLVRYLTKGFVIDAPRLRDAGDHDRIAELREIVRDIRASEANVYAELRRICALCRDYDPASDAARQFYRHMQAKLFWAVTSRTPAMLLRERAKAGDLHMGLQTWPKDDVRQQDALVAKNYLADGELRELNRLTTLLLDIFDDQLGIGRLTLMREANELLDVQLRNLNRAVLSHGGDVSHEAAETHVREQYRSFDEARRKRRAEEVLREVEALKAEGKALPKAKARKPRSN